MHNITPFQNIAPVTPADGSNLSTQALALLVHTAGDIKLTTVKGNTVTVTVPAGLIPIHCTKVFATGTTATGISALW